MDNGNRLEPLDTYLPVVAIGENSRYDASHAQCQNETRSSQDLVLDALTVVVPHAQKFAFGRHQFASNVIINSVNS